ncbi:MAG: NUDIX domain-containing protein [Clostridium sp.]|uniref:NUDIX domain-containing protein n=1 Tax=Clostridium sp. TaxID=1506 RepID=UPI003EE72B23
MGFLDSKIKTLENGFQVLEMPDSVNFALVTKDKYAIFASQYRASVNSEHINLFGGYVDNGENTLMSLKREMLEETNIDYNICLHKMEVVYVNKLVSSGTSTERNSLFLIELNETLEEIEKTLKCNDEKEGIAFKAIKIDENFEHKTYHLLHGIRSYVAVMAIIRKYS